MLLQIISVLVLMISAALCAPGGERQNMRLARDDKPPQQPPQSSGTLDSIGGGNLLRVVDPDVQEQLFQLGEIGSTKKGEENLAREDNSQKNPQPSRTVDSLGGGNIVRVEEPNREKPLFRSLEIGERKEAGVRQNTMMLARDDKPQQPTPSSGTLDPIGGDSIVRVADSYSNEQLFRSLELARLLDNYHRDEVLRMMDAITGGDLLSALDATERMALVDALKRQSRYSKRMLDNAGDWGVGERQWDFDQIDRVGFVGWAKQSPPRQNPNYSSLTKRNFN